MDMTVDAISLLSLGIIVTKGPIFKKPKRRILSKTIEGVDGSTSDYLGYESYYIPFEITPTDATKFNQIYALLDGPRVIVCSDDPNNYRNVEFNDEISYDTLAIWKQASISMFVPLPFRYPIVESDQIITTSTAIINNPGTYFSTPILKITGTGLVNITLNGVNFTYNFDTPYVYMDCAQGQSRGAYHLTVRKNSRKTGGYPTLSPGNNTLSVNSGTVTQIVVTKRSRYL